MPKPVVELEFTYLKDTTNHYVFKQKDFDGNDKPNVKFYPEQVYVNKKYFTDKPSSIKIIIN
jgi:hypothetical protein